MSAQTMSCAKLFVFLSLLCFTFSACNEESGKNITDAGTVVPPGTDLTGVWTSNTLSITAGGNTATFAIEFSVYPDSLGKQIVTGIYLVDESSKEEVPGSVEIQDGRFSYSRDFPDITCNGIPAQLVIKGAFRTDSTADGEWSDRNFAPPGYIFCGTASGKWQAKRTFLPAFASFLTHNTGSLQVSVFDNGNIGHLQTFADGNGVKFNSGPDAMYSAGIIFGTAGRGKVNGQIGSFGINYDLKKISEFSGFYTLPPDWNQVADVYYFDAIAPDPYGVDIYQTSYSNSAEDFMFLRYRLYTYGISGSDLYVGIFADWDVGVNGFDVNLGGYDLSRNLVYQYQSGGSEDANYYGIIALDGLSGARITTHVWYETARDSAFTWITTFANESIDTTGDYRTFIGCGPLTYASGNYTEAYFCIVAGSDLSDLLSNADYAILKYNNVLKKK
jgi:hypothetical protein